jgi:quaternary ammonium compound-resistance protein SugE
VAWLILVVAGLFEVAWAVLLPTTRTFTRPLPTFATLVCLVVSMVGLAVAARTLPIGTAYAVWVGVGAAGTVAFGILVHGDPVSPLRVMFLALLVVSIVGLRATSG